jgi:hypothetical protein
MSDREKAEKCTKPASKILQLLLGVPSYCSRISKPRYVELFKFYATMFPRASSSSGRAIAAMSSSSSSLPAMVGGTLLADQPLLCAQLVASLFTTFPFPLPKFLEDDVLPFFIDWLATSP